VTRRVSAQTTAPASAPADSAPAAFVAKPQKTPHKKVTRSVVVLITNSRAVVLTQVGSDAIRRNSTKGNCLQSCPGKKTSVKVATDKSCVFNLHGDYADGSSTDSTSVDLSRDKNVNVVE
jgi:hypothetical protein